MNIIYGRGYIKDANWSFSSSNSHDPFFNLAWENELLHGEFEGDSHLFLYRNNPCIVSGRFQVPWREMNFLYRRGESGAPNTMNETHETKLLPYVRRRSGGGTVYHDLGNWNFCFVHRGRELKREENLKEVITICKNLGQEIYMNERFDLVTDCDQKTFKVSGSAFKQKKDFALHHGTLLVQAGIDQLKGALGMTSGWNVTGKGIPSVPSPVINLVDLDYSHWEKSWCEHLGIGVLEERAPFDGGDRFLKEQAELASWQWRFGETPKHRVELSLELELGSSTPKAPVTFDFQKGCVTGHSGLPEVTNIIGLKACGEGSHKIEKIINALDQALNGQIHQDKHLHSKVRTDFYALFSDKTSI